MVADQNQVDGVPMYPVIEPRRADWLDVGGHRVYFEECGNPRGFPVLFLHGGPGSRTRAVHRRFFDPDFYRIVLFDQRGCGQSTPAGSTQDNTTAHLVADIELLRRKLGVDHWLLFGGSWGSTLALAYAIEHPRRVAGMVLRGVFLASHDELQWYLHGLRRFIPDAWERFTGGSPDAIVARYRALADHPDSALAESAVRRWCDYENAVMAIGETAPGRDATPVAELLARARVQLHYLANDCFLRPNQLLDNLWRVGSTPSIVVQGGMDMVCPPVSAFAVARRLAAAELRLVPAGGHSALQPAIAAELCAATARMRRNLEIASSRPG